MIPVEITKQWAAFIRALRTFIQGFIAAGLAAGYDSVTGAITGGTGFDFKKLAVVAVVAFLAGGISYLHNLVQKAPEVTE